MGERDDSELELRSRALFHDSVEGLDMRIRSRLTQARSVALQAVDKRRPWLSGWRMWTPAAGMTAAAILGVAIWLAGPLSHQATMADGRSNFEDLELVAASDENSGDALEMVQDDLDFYDFADKSANPGSGA